MTLDQTKHRYRMSLLLCLVGISACSTQQRIWQTGPVISLLNGVYDGTAPVSEIRRHGNLGVGLWDKANGEGLVVDGIFYQVTADGIAHVKNDADIMPWAMVTDFKAERMIELPPGISMQTIADYIDKQLPTINTFYALRIEGEFSYVQARSEATQKKPYKPFAEVEKHEVKFDFKDVTGVMVGFRSPPYVTNVSVPGYHLHFLNRQRSSGGHVLQFTVKNAVLYLNKVDRFQMNIPDSPGFNRADLDHIMQ